MRKLDILSFVIFVVLSAMVAHQYFVQNQFNDDLKKFVSVGPRFTADDGEVLCERVRTLETLSHGYREAKKPVSSCNYKNR